MKTILVTGGTGVLGHEIVGQLQTTQHQIRIMSRQATPSSLPPNTTWAQADLTSGHGLEAAINGADVVINCATSPHEDSHQVDVLGLERMLQIVKQAGVQHFFHISIVGIEDIQIPYYRQKVAAEKAVENSNVPFSLIRITQFHTLLDDMLAQVTKRRWLPLLPLPGGAVYQLIDPQDVAAYLLPHILSNPAGYLEDVGGPDVLTYPEIARQWLAIQGKRRIIVSFPVPGKIGRALRKGANTAPFNRYGTLTWQDYLEEKYGNHRLSNAIENRRLERSES